MNTDWFLDAFDGVDFARRRLGFDPDAKQSLMLGKRIRRGLLNCSRQWGKSTVAAAKAVHQAESTPQSLVVVLSPGARQSAELLRKAGVFVAVGYPAEGGWGQSDVAAVSERVADCGIAR